MTTIAEDLETVLDTDWNDGTVTMTSHVFMKTNQNTTKLEPPANPAANKCTIVIMEGIGTPIRYTIGADLIIYDGVFHVFCPSYATLILSLAELKQIANNNTTGTGTLTFSVPMIEGEINRGLFLATIRYNWEKITDRG